VWCCDVSSKSSGRLPSNDACRRMSL
jgi:hypothetical protein